MLTGEQQVWERDGFAEKTGLGERGAGIGYGDTPEQAREIQVHNPDVLIDYIQAAAEAYRAYVHTVSEEQLDDVVDERFDPPVKRGVRLVSMVDDALQHVGQVFYAKGILEK